MKDIKTKDKSNKGIKTLNKASTWTERIKDPIVSLNRQSNEVNNNDADVNEYGSEKIKYYTNRLKDESLHNVSASSSKAKDLIKKKIQKKKIKSHTVNKIKGRASDIKNVTKNVNKINNVGKQMFIQGKKLAISMARTSRIMVMAIARGLVMGVKALIGALSSLIGILASGGAIVIIIVVIICLIAMLLGSVFGIFFSNDSGSRTMTSVISEINQEVYRKVDNEKLLSQADEVVFESTYSNWKEVISVYSVKYSGDESSRIVMYLDDKNVNNLKNVFYDFNTITTEVRNETNDSTSFNPGSFQISNNDKKILYVNVNSKSLDDVMKNYNFTESQKEQIRELTSSEYDDMWSNLLYGSETGDYIYWRQKGAEWSNIMLGNSGKTIGDIGCLATSISVLIEKSGVNNSLIPFNPGVFVTKLNENNGFDSEGNLQYAAINKVIPNFEYVGKVNLNGKTQKEKLTKIKTYYEQGYYIAVEVMGSTGQHWIAVVNVNGNIIKMVDPSSDSTDLWSTYNWKNTSQFVYFRIKK